MLEEGEHHLFSFEGMKEFEVILSSDIDKEYFKENTVKKFKNFMGGGLAINEGIASFVSLRKIVVKGVKEERFLVNLEGLPLRTVSVNSGDLPVLACCAKPDAVNEDQRIYSYPFEEYTPFSLGRASEWCVSIIPWGCESVQYYEEHASCVIHLNIRVGLEVGMDFVHESAYLRMEYNAGCKCYVANLPKPLIIKNGDSVGVRSCVGGGLLNVVDGSNTIKISLDNERMKKSQEFSVNVPEGMYSSLNELLGVINKCMAKLLKNATESSELEEVESLSHILVDFSRKGDKVRVMNRCIYQMFMHMPEGLHSLLGLSERFFLGPGRGPGFMVYGENPLNPTIPNTLALECSLVKRGLVGDKKFRVIGLVETTNATKLGTFNNSTSLPYMVKGERGDYWSVNCDLIEPISGKSVACTGSYMNIEVIVKQYVKNHEIESYI